MADNLNIFDVTYPNATGIKAKDTNGVTQTFVKPSGTVNITSSGTTDVSAYANASVAAGAVTAPATISGTSATVSTGTNTLTLSKTVSVTPNVTTAGYISSGTAGNSSVSLTASVTTKGAATITPSTTQQTIASGTYLTGTQTIAAMPSGTAGTPTATKGTVSNHSISVTPSVTNTTGYITGSTKTGTAVTVSASELVSGSETKTQNGTYDVTNLAELVVNVSGGGSSGLAYEEGTYIPTTDIARPTITFANTHSTPPVFAMMTELYSSSVTVGSDDNLVWVFTDPTRENAAISGNMGFVINTGTERFNAIFYAYRTSSIVAAWTNTTYSSYDTVSTSTSQSRYWATETDIKPYTNSTSRYWHSGRTYRWIAIWR